MPQTVRVVSLIYIDMDMDIDYIDMYGVLELQLIRLVRDLKVEKLSQ